MKTHFLKLRRASIALVCANVLAGCGGGDAPVPREVVVLMKTIPDRDGAPYRELVQLLDAQIEVSDLRCAFVRPTSEPDPFAIVTYILVVDINARDAEKVKALGFTVFGLKPMERINWGFCR